MVDRDLVVTEDELHAYVDGELPPDRREAVETWLATHADDNLRVAAWRTQIETLRARYGAVAKDPVPARLALDRIATRRRKWIGVAAAATVAAFVIGSAAGWWARGASAAAPNEFDVFTSEAVDAHRLYVVEVRHPVEVTAAEASHLVQWLSKRLNYQVRAPDLESIGLKLIGGRLLPGPGGAAAFLMYESATGERFTIYCTRANAPNTALRFNTFGQVGAFYWVDGDFVFVVSGESDRGTLQKIAETSYEQLETRSTNRARGS
jgi:anti-sigma factor RsiW